MLFLDLSIVYSATYVFLNIPPVGGIPKKRLTVGLISYKGGSICNENPFITPSTNEVGFYAIYQTKAQSVAVIMVHKTLFYHSKFNKLQTF